MKNELFINYYRTFSFIKKHQLIQSFRLQWRWIHRVPSDTLTLLFKRSKKNWKGNRLGTGVAKTRDKIEFDRFFGEHTTFFTFQFFKMHSDIKLKLKNSLTCYFLGNQIAVRMATWRFGERCLLKILKKTFARKNVGHELKKDSLKAVKKKEFQDALDHFTKKKDASLLLPPFCVFKWQFVMELKKKTISDRYKVKYSFEGLLKNVTTFMKNGNACVITI